MGCGHSMWSHSNCMRRWAGEFPLSVRDCYSFISSSSSIQRIWLELHAIHPAASSCLRIADLWKFSPNDKVRSKVLISLQLWNIWKRMNVMAFHQELEGLHTMVQRCANELHLWASRCSAATRKVVLTDWAVMLAHLAQQL
ncbi:hypothetical protein BRADI_5g10096v3 [Brachypodium distachyon]|uniref:Uncharacterized protein n=1 Tax=Brachypodium distachyon TaxID=15368 RepID=A0A0Q3I936_BRADI|nr:hypothetical protein BRADI_5g10096v3 [Brachypodium distachyon]